MNKTTLLMKPLTMKGSMADYYFELHNPASNNVVNYLPNGVTFNLSDEGGQLLIATSRALNEDELGSLSDALQSWSRYLAP